MANVATTSTAGIITDLMYDVVNSNWIIETGASNHMFHNPSLMHQYTDLGAKRNMSVNLPTGGQVPISHIGESLVLKEKTVRDVLFILDFKHNLLFISQQTKQLQFVLLFSDFCIFQDLSNERVLGIGKEDQCLHLLQTELKDTGGLQVAKNHTPIGLVVDKSSAPTSSINLTSSDSFVSSMSSL